MRDEIERYENLLRGQSDERVRQVLREMISEKKEAASRSQAAAPVDRKQGD